MEDDQVQQSGDTRQDGAGDGHQAGEGKAGDGPQAGEGVRMKLSNRNF